MANQQLGGTSSPLNRADIEDAWKQRREGEWQSCARGKLSHLKVRWYGANGGCKFFGCGSVEPNENRGQMEVYVDRPYRPKSMQNFDRLKNQVDSLKEDIRILRERITHLELLLGGATHLIDRLLLKLENTNEPMQHT